MTFIDGWESCSSFYVIFVFFVPFFVFFAVLLEKCWRVGITRNVQYSAKFVPFGENGLHHGSLESMSL